MRTFAQFACLMLASSVSVTLHAQSTANALPMCAASQLSLATDQENGNFDGMSHSGTLLVLRNLGPNACRVEAFPKITFNDAKGPVKIVFTTPGAKFMHPGPVMLPSTVAVGAEITSSLRWVSSPVYDPGICYDVKSVMVQIGNSKAQSKLDASICGASSSSVSVERSRFSLDPTYKPAAPK